MINKTKIPMKMDFFCYHDIDTKFPPSLAITNFRRGTRGAHDVSSPLPTEFSLYAWVRNRTPTTCLRESNPLPLRPTHLVIFFFILWEEEKKLLAPHIRDSQIHDKASYEVASPFITTYKGHFHSIQVSK
jgi:hypothetical protein